MNNYRLKFTFINRENETKENEIQIEAGDKSEAKNTAIKQLKNLHAIVNPVFTSIEKI